MRHTKLPVSNRHHSGTTQQYLTLQRVLLNLADEKLADLHLKMSHDKLANSTSLNRLRRHLLVNTITCLCSACKKNHQKNHSSVDRHCKPATHDCLKICREFTGNIANVTLLVNYQKITGNLPVIYQ